METEVLLGTSFVLSLYLAGASRCTQSQHSPTALPLSYPHPLSLLLKPLGHHSPAFSSCSVKAIKCSLHISSPTAWIKLVGSCSPYGGPRLEHLTLVAKGTCISGPHRTKHSERQFLAGYYSLITAQIANGHTPQSS